MGDIEDVGGTDLRRLLRREWRWRDGRKLGG